jgi:gas vesicle protein
LYRYENPFTKTGNNGLVATLLIGGIAASAVVYLYLSESGTKARVGLKKKIREKVKDKVSDVVHNKTGISKKAVKAVVDHLIK